MIATPSPINLPGKNNAILPNVSLQSLTSYRVGGSAQWYAAPRNTEALHAAYEWFLKQDLPLTLLGAGSNLLISDQGLPGLVLCTKYLRYRKINKEAAQVTVAAGEPIPRLAWLVAKLGWHGLEWAVGIPGTVGGAVVMNAGAHDSCIADCLVSAQVISPDGRVEVLTKDDMNYGYRTSALQGDRRMVIEATFQLEPGYDPKAVKAETHDNFTMRKTSQPYDKPSCGSVFRNPKPQAAGWLIEQMGLKGHAIGGAQISQRHANFILNSGGAKAEDIFRMIHYVQAQVESHWSIFLKPEVKIIGEFPAI